MTISLEERAQHSMNLAMNPGTHFIHTQLLKKKSLRGLASLIFLILNTMVLWGCQHLQAPSPLSAGPSMPIVQLDQTSSPNIQTQKNDQPPLKVLLTADAMRGRAYALRNSITLHHWVVKDNPLNIASRTQLIFYQYQAKALLKKALKHSQTFHQAGLTQQAQAFLPVLKLLSQAPALQEVPSPTSDALVPQSDITALNHLVSPALLPITSDDQLQQELNIVLSALDKQEDQNQKTIEPAPLKKNKVTHQALVTQNQNPTVATEPLPNLETINHVVQKGSLFELKTLIHTINSHDSAPLSAKIHAQALNAFLNYQIKELNTQADDYYQQGQLQEAKALWTKLQQLSPSDQQLATKISRAETVLENIEQLRLNHSNTQRQTPQKP